MRKAGLSLVSLLAAVAAMLRPDPALACGGCLAPTSTVTNVDAHRMVVSLSPERSILWDQIQYSGDPEDFVWVLPVPSPEVELELSDNSFFTSLDSGTAPRVQPQPLFNGGSGGPSIGCGGSEALSAGGEQPETEVTVYDQQVVGPYETVVIGSEDPEALYTWLLERDYAVSEETAQTMDAYIDQESVFLILRLAPDEGTEAMQPVRVTYPGFMGTFPLEMVKVGARAELELSLWVIAEQRYEAGNYANTTVARDDLVYDWDDNSSNYDEAFLKAIDDAGGRAWVTEYAGPLPWLSSESQAELEAILTDNPYPYVTRLRTTMRLEYLTEDLELVTADSGPVDSLLIAGNELNRPEQDQGGGGSDDGCQAGSLGRMNFMAFLGLGALLALTRRRRWSARQ